MKVKICGIVDAEDSRMAISYGADAIGFIVGVRHKAEDAIEAERAKQIVASLPPFASSVLVTHLVEAEPITQLWELVGSTAIQLQDDIPLSQIRLLKKHLPAVPLIKAIHITGVEAISKALRYEGLVDAIIADTIMSTNDRIGGTGKPHDWKISRRIREESPLPLILAGGLTPENVALAIETVKPYAVDVNSGVDDSQHASRGKKVPERLEAFVQRAKQVGKALGL